MDSDMGAQGLSRRRLVLAGAALATLSILSPASSGWAAVSHGERSLFMQVSQLITPESLSPQTGIALYSALKQQNPALDSHLQTLEKIISATPDITIEVLSDTLKKNQQQTELATLNGMVAAWYTGIVGHRTYAYETALMYRPTRDVLSPPSYTRGGPLNWKNTKAGAA